MIPGERYMKHQPFSTPILLLGFNRPDLLEQQLQRVLRLDAEHIYIAIDGPRAKNESDVQANIQIRKVCAEFKTHTPIHCLFQEKNLGCRLGVSTAITWFFSKVKDGIILEDDCAVDPSFFTFAEELLHKYKDDHRIWQISAANFTPSSDVKTSYRFSMHPLCWGWATWRDRWDAYDIEMAEWEERKDQILSRFHTKRSRQYWNNIFQSMYDKKIDTWDYQWIYSIWKNDGVSVIPSVNLVSNIGFDDRATHTKFSLSPLAHRKTEKLTFPLTHPSEVTPDVDADNILQKLFESSVLEKVATYFLRKIL